MSYLRILRNISEFSLCFCTDNTIFFNVSLTELLPEVHISSQEQGNESDLAGKVKELGRMFEGGGPVFPKTVKNDTDAGRNLDICA